MRRKAIAVALGLAFAGGTLAIMTLPSESHGKHRGGYSAAHAGERGYHHGQYHRGGRDRVRHHRAHGSRHAWRMIRNFRELYDTDGDGRVTTEEVETVRADMFNRHDADGDGRLTIDEFESLWLEKMRLMMVRNFQRYDRDGTGEISLEDFNRNAERIARVVDRRGERVRERRERREERRGMRHRQKQDTEQSTD